LKVSIAQSNSEESNILRDSIIVHSALTQAVATLLSALLVQMQDRSVGSHFDWTMAVSKQLN